MRFWVKSGPGLLVSGKDKDTNLLSNLLIKQNIEERVPNSDMHAVVTDEPLGCIMRSSSLNELHTRCQQLHLLHILVIVGHVRQGNHKVSHGN